MTKISDLAALTGAAADVAADLVAVVDMSLSGAARNKKMTLAELKVALGLPAKECIVVAVSDEATAITVGVTKVTIHAPYAFTLTEVWIGLSTVSSSGAVTVDVNKAGATMLSTNPSIVAGQETNLTGGGTAAVISTTAVAKGEKLTFDIDAAGTGAKGLKVYLIGKQ